MIILLNMTTVEKAKELFKKMITDFGSDPYCLLVHVTEMEKWAKYMLEKHPDADKDVVMLAVWLHDIGHYPLPKEIDHAVRGEERAKEFLEKENFDPEKTKKVLHCVRAHRCRDVQPETKEAKIIAFIDSASHSTDLVTFPDMVNVYKETKKVLDKLERDFKDLEFFPEEKEKLRELYEAWKTLLKAIENTSRP